MCSEGLEHSAFETRNREAEKGSLPLRNRLARTIAMAGWQGSQRARCPYTLADEQPTGN